MGDLGSIPVLGRSSGEGKGYPLQSSDLVNSMDCIVHGFAKSQTQLSDSLSLLSEKTGGSLYLQVVREIIYKMLQIIIL